MSDHNEAMRLAGELVAPIGTQTSYQTAHEAAALLRKQAERIAELEKMQDESSDVEASLRDQVAAVTADLDTLRADADRYRWLRAAHWSSEPLCCVLDPKANVRLGATCPSGDQLDTAIDTARKATQ